MENKQISIFDFDDNSNDWEKEYIGMPEYDNSKRIEPFITATFKFRNQKDFDLFNSVIKKHLFDGVKPFDGMQRKDIKSTWFPLTEKGSKYLYEDES